MKIPLKVLPTVLKPVTPIIEKRAANYAADYLNKRRQARLAGDQGPETETAATIDPHMLKAHEATDPVRRFPWLAVLGTALGAGVGALLCYVYLKRR